MGEDRHRTDLDLQCPSSESAEKAAEFLLSWVRQLAGKKACQGLRKTTWPVPCGCEALAEISRFRIYRMPEEAANGLFAWADGFPVVLTHRVLEPREILLLQAQGLRCVSLVDDNAQIAPHENPYEFLIHDLCHLAHFINPVHYYGQVGFFANLQRALVDPRWIEFERPLDRQWQKDKNYVLADMNGSVVFLFASLKIRLKLAIYRRSKVNRAERKTNDHAAEKEEIRCNYERALSLLCDSFELDGPIRHAAMKISARRDHPDAAAALINYFSAIGRDRAQHFQYNRSRPLDSAKKSKSVVSYPSDPDPAILPPSRSDHMLVPSVRRIVDRPIEATEV